MLRRLIRVLSFAAIAMAFGCGQTSHSGPARVASTRGSAIVVSGDGKVAVVCHRSTGVVTVLRLTPGASAASLVAGKTELDLGSDWEPWSAVIGADGDTAYVVSRRQQVVLRILNLHGTPIRDNDASDVAVGSEPTSIAISPSGARIFVANFGEGTISVISTFDLKARKLDLNEALVRTGVLGSVEPRAALAHPRALAITDNGDANDADETLYATEFFSQPLPESETPTAADDVTHFNRNRQGFVYPVSFAAGEVGTPIAIQGVDNTGFSAAPNAKLPTAIVERPVGCFPNQLYSAVAANGRLFVTSECASPVGPLGPDKNADGTTNPANFKKLVHPVVFVINTKANREIPEHRLLLNQRLEQHYTDDLAETRRMALIPNDIAVTQEPNSELKVCTTALGSDSVFCSQYGEDGFGDIGTAGARYVDLHPLDQEAGLLPIGLSFTGSEPAAVGLVANDGSQNVSVFDLKDSVVRGATKTAELSPRAKAVTSERAHNGRTLFATGLSAWSFKGQGWLSCESCHPDGLSDGVTWFFARGPRRTISTAGTYDQSSPQKRRLMLWTASIDEIHDIEGITRGVAGGSGAMLWNYLGEPNNDFRIQYDGSPVTPSTPEAPKPRPTSQLRNNLNNSLASLVSDRSCPVDAAQCNSTRISDSNDIDAFIRTVKTPRAPTYLEPGDVSDGARLFQEGRCNGCHAGSAFTLSNVFYEPGPIANGELPYSPPPALTDSMLGSLRTTLYSVSSQWSTLNPPAKNGSATLRRWAPGTDDPIAYAYSGATAGSDQINCILRDVGTFPVQPAQAPWALIGITPEGAPPVRELKQDMVSLAMGQTGFNIPSLLGLSVGAPYFHAGNARTLEEVLDKAFSKHHQAFVPGFLADSVAEPQKRAAQVKSLVAYLLSIDDSSPPIAPAEVFGGSPDLCEAVPGVTVFGPVSGIPGTGAGGSGGAPGAGGAASGGAGTAGMASVMPMPSPLGDGTAIASAGQDCKGSPFPVACAGHAQKTQLVCKGGVWLVNQICSVDYNCDTTPGPTAGQCQAIVPECATRQANATVCQGLNRMACGADLVSTTAIEVCGGGCVSGACTACEPLTKRCTDGGSQTCDASGVGAATPCPDSTPVCIGAGSCGSPPSCAGLAATCGASVNTNCCATTTVPGGTFNRSNDASYPATVSDFRLDNYEVTVGRFRKFVATYSQGMIPAGAGKNANNPADPGWDIGWNASLPADAAALTAAVKCDATFQTWTDGAGGNENRPINCVNWYEAQAFCMWDGGRLPTEAEWNYAAAGGSEQRVYPWGGAVPGANASLAVYGCYYNGAGSCSGVANIAPVGSVVAGNGKWSQSDLAGNLWEWNQDVHGTTYSASCNNCANLSNSTNRVIRGGGFIANALNLASADRGSSIPADHGSSFGLRCARTR